MKKKLFLTFLLTGTIGLGLTSRPTQTQAIDPNPLIPYIEIGETTYIQGDENATFNGGIPFHSNGNDYAMYVYISNKNIYNSTTNPNQNPYITYNDTLVFLNFVVYEVGTGDANAWTFRLNNELGTALYLSEWQTIRHFNISINRYQNTNFFTTYYEYTYNVLGHGQHATGWDSTPITGVNQAHTIFGSGLSGITLTDALNFQIHTRFYGYTLYELQSEYNRGFNNGFTSGYDYGYPLGDSAGYNRGINELDPYGTGYQDGARDKFMANFDKWIVPAIIVIMFLGGFISVMSMRSNKG